ncbi:hypothetical protein BC943DRAFT_307808 [Umbelopsis sp. AD052]|nr:hypothetical protein BC943DRAFT_307808 [Umbelopsis sp. AD052]
MPTHPSKDLYEILGLSKESATDSTIRTAYRRLALRCHPDKQSANATEEEKQKAAEDFQEIGIAYAVLSDEKRKKTYDRTGRISEGIDLDDSEKDWDAYFRELWSGEVDASTIEAFAAKYKGSDEEKDDLLAAYEECKGDMDKILTMVLCSNEEDAPRFKEIIQKAIEDKSIKRYGAFTSSTSTKAGQRRKRNADREAKEAESYAKEMGLDKKLWGKKGEDDESSLKALIQARNAQRNERLESMMDAIVEREEAKAKAKSKAKGKAKTKAKSTTK